MIGVFMLIERAVDAVALSDAGGWHVAGNAVDASVS